MCQICGVIGVHSFIVRTGEPKLRDWIDCELDENQQPVLERIRKNISYFLGNAIEHTLLSKAAETLFNRDYKNNKQIFVPECFLTKDPTMIEKKKEKLEKLLAERTTTGNLTPEEAKKWRCKIKTLEGEAVEKTVYDTLKSFYKLNSDQEVLVLHGYEIMDLEMPYGKKEIPHGEKDFIIVNFTVGYIMNIEVKSSLNGKSLKDAKRQLEETKKLFEKWFGADLNSNWVFISAIYCERDDKTNKN